MKGIIALDIDGTITDKAYHIPQQVTDFLKSLVDDGWVMVFITGRTFAFATHVLHSLHFPYYLAVQNGAIILKMPDNTIVSKKYINSNVLSDMEVICQSEPTDFVIAAGYEYQDRFYFRPEKFSEELLDYLEKRCVSQKEHWVPVKSFDDIDAKSYASVKFFGFKESTIRISTKVEEQLGLHAPNISDPFNKGHYIVQATHPEVNKGQAFLDVAKIFDWDGKRIAAGDDYNDMTMLEVAHIKVVMSSAPKELLEQADIIAPPASEMGIIKGLEKAING